MSAPARDWRPISDPPAVNEPVALVCVPQDGSAPTFRHYAVGWLYAPLDWNVDRVPAGWPATHWKPLGTPT